MTCCQSYGASGDSCCFCHHHGWALAHSFWPRETVADVARTLERSRFRRIGTHSAREAELVAALLEVKPDGHCRPRENVRHLDAPKDWELVSEFDEVAGGLDEHGFVEASDNFFCVTSGICVSF